MPRNQIYFRNLNALRFIGAFMVIIHHLEQFKGLFNHPNYFTTELVHSFGKLGVILFFVLSGFLITYLLLEEKRVTGQIRIKDFYIRRILRIWPLYYLIALSAIFIFPFVPLFQVPGMDAALLYKNLLPKLIFTLTLLPNVAAWYGSFPGANQLWSIGLEEQFYLFWPHLFRLKRSIIYSLAILYLLGSDFGMLIPQSHYVIITLGLIGKFNITNMVIGGLFAMLYFDKKDKILSILYNWRVQVLTLVLIFSLMPFELNYFSYGIYPFLFAILILNLSTNSKTIINLENRVTNYLGQISYGLYMYHSISIIFILNVLERVRFYNSLLTYILSFALTIGLSHFSFKYFEKRFIKLKGKFAVIKSGGQYQDEKLQSSFLPNLKTETLNVY